MSPGRIDAPRDGDRAWLGLAIPAALALLLAAWGWTSYAQQPATIVQSAMVFQPTTVNIRPGQSVTFVNNDPFGHNVYSLTPGGEFDIGLQPPGTQSAVPFARSGTFDVRCRIHPKMRAQIVVR